MRQALELALEALLHAYHEDEAHPKTLETITAIKEALAQPEQETVAVEFEKMTGVPNAWNNPALMQVRNGFIGGWEAAQSKKSENFDTWMKNPYTKTIMESIKNDYQPKKPKNEPVAWYDKDGVITTNPIEFSQPLYTTPPQRKPLTDEAIATVYWGATGQSLRPQDNVLAHKFARAIEVAHGIKE